MKLTNVCSRLKWPIKKATLILLFFIMNVTFSAFGKSNGFQFITFDHFQLNSDISLSHIKNLIGETALVTKGDAASFSASICYKTSKGRIYFLSGEMGGMPDDGHELLGFKLINKPSNDKNCYSWPLNKEEPKLEIGGLWLGMTAKEFAQVLNTKLTWKNHVAEAYFESKLEMTDAEKKLFHIDNDPDAQSYFDVSVSVDGRFLNDKLTSLEVWKITSY